MDPTEPFCRNEVSPGLRRPSHQAHPRALWSIVRKALRVVLRKPSADLANRQPPDQLSFRKKFLIPMNLFRRLKVRFTLR